MITPNLTLNIWSFGSNIFVVSRQKHSVKVCRSQIASTSCNFTSLFLVVVFFFFICKMEKEQYLFLRHV